MKLFVATILGIFLALTSCQQFQFKGKIAFTSQKEGETQAFTVEPNTSEIKPIKGDSSFGYGSNISPDGTELATVSKRNIVMVNIATGTTKTLAEDKSAYYLRWSPNGQYIAFSEGSDGYTDLAVVDTNGQYRRLTYQQSTNGMSSGWLPNNKDLIFQGKDYELFTLNMDKPEEIKQLTHTEKSSDDGRPNMIRKLISVAPNGKHIAYMAEFRDTSKKSGIYISDIDGSNQRLIITTKVRPFNTWSPDSKYLAIDLFKNKRSDIYIVNLKGKILKNLTTGFNDQNFSPTWSLK